MFENIKNVNLNFSNCDNCPKTCCKNILIPLILDDFKSVYKNFPIIFAYMNDELRVLILLGNNWCRYLKEDGCSIYQNRPPSCKIYPISPFFEDFYVDISCEAVGVEGEFLCSSSGFNSNFYHHRLENFVEKYSKTVKFLKSIENDIVEMGDIENIKIYKYGGENRDSYIQMHLESLNYHHFNQFFVK